MQKKQLFSLFFLLCSSISCLLAQGSFHTSIYFDTDKAELRWSEKITLDTFLSNIKTYSDVEVAIESYTDDQGSEAYNKTLAEKRANTVSKWLAQNNIIPKSLKISPLGEINDGQTSNEARQRNRRVDMVVSYTNIASVEELEQFFKTKNQKAIEINANNEEQITGDKGVILTIPAQAFEREDGRLAQGNITIQLTEALSPADWIFNGLSTISNGQLLETGGMVNIDAMSDDKQPLRLRKGKNIRVEIPTNGNQEGMELFYANHQTANKSFDWVQAPNLTNSPSIRKKKPYYLLRKGLVDTIRNNTRVPKAIKNPTPTLVTINMPKRPVFAQDSKPHRPIFSPPLEHKKRLFQKDNYEIRYKESVAYYEGRVKRYLKDSVKHQTAKQRYDLAFEHYVSDSMRAMVLAKQNYEKVRHYISVEFKNMLCNSMFLFLNRPTKSWRFQEEDFFTTCYNKIDDVAEQRFTYSHYKEVLEEKYLHHYKVDFVQYNQRYYTNVNSPIQKLKDSLYTSSGLRKNLEEAYLTVVKERLKEDLANGKTTGISAYVFEMTQVGWANVDRFLNYRNLEKAVVQVNQPSDVKLYLLCKDIRSFIPLSYDPIKQFVSPELPKNTSVKLIAIQVKAGVVMYSAADYVIGNIKSPIVPNYTSMPLATLGEELKKLK